MGPRPAHHGGAVGVAAAAPPRFPAPSCAGDGRGHGGRAGRLGARRRLHRVRVRAAGRATVRLRACGAAARRLPRASRGGAVRGRRLDYQPGKRHRGHRLLPRHVRLARGAGSQRGPAGGAGTRDDRRAQGGRDSDSPGGRRSRQHAGEPVRPRADRELRLWQLADRGPRRGADGSGGLSVRLAGRPGRPQERGCSAAQEPAPEVHRGRCRATAGGGSGFSPARDARGAVDAVHAPGHGVRRFRSGRSAVLQGGHCRQ